MLKIEKITLLMHNSPKVLFKYLIGKRYYVPIGCSCAKTKMKTNLKTKVLVGSEYVKVSIEQEWSLTAHGQRGDNS